MVQMDTARIRVAVRLLHSYADEQQNALHTNKMYADAAMSSTTRLTIYPAMTSSDLLTS